MVIVCGEIYCHSNTCIISWGHCELSMIVHLEAKMIKANCIAGKKPTFAEFWITY